MGTDRHRSRTGLAVLVLVALALITIDYRQGATGTVASVQRGLLAVFSPVQEGFATVVRPIGGFFGSVAELRTLRAEHAALEAEVSELRGRDAAVTDLERENAELRRLLAMRERLGYSTAGAQVIAQPANTFDNTVLLDVGADGGVEQGMAVLNGFGLVGKVTQVTARNARVQLLTAPDATYAARIAGSGEEGLLSGRGSRPFQLELFDPDADIEPGTEVVTHAFQGTSIPDGIPVGEIEDGDARGAGPGLLAVRPFVDFTRMSRVQVVLDAPLHPAELDPEELVDDAGGDPQPPTVGARDASSDGGEG